MRQRCGARTFPTGRCCTRRACMTFSTRTGGAINRATGSSTTCGTRSFHSPPPAGIPDLPSRYVAVKFYFNDCFPADEQNRAFVRDVLRTLAARGPVVALSTGLNIDDHGGARVDEHGVRHLPEGIDPARNLHVQSAIVSRGRRVCRYLRRLFLHGALLRREVAGVLQRSPTASRRSISTWRAPRLTPSAPPDC